MENKNYNYVWLSLDPVNCKIVYYPKYIANQLEKKYIETNGNGDCVLGSNFYNATVHFNNDSIYQTTQGSNMGRCNFKQPGYRNVLRLLLNNNNNNIKVYVNNIRGEWRISNEIECSDILEDNISNEYIINSNFKYVSSLTYWIPDDLTNKNYNKNVIIWEWCRSTRGNIHYLDDSYWIPYLYENNKLIEESFQNNKKIIIKINNDEEREIHLESGNCYGFQKSIDNTKVRNIRRKIINIDSLINKISNINKLPYNINILENIVNFDEIPNQFICCISQDIMNDPVKTVDNHSYDRKSIERWFLNSSKSPLTGLNLYSKLLVSNIELKKEIDNYTKLKLEQFNNMLTV